MGTLMQDVKYGLRMLAKSPGVTVVALLSLALGIGANTAIFSVVNAVLLRPLPFSEPARLATIFGTYSKLGETNRSLSYPDLEDLQKQNTVFERVAGYTTSSVTFTGSAGSTHLDAANVSAGMFPLLDVAPILGAGFVPGDDRPGHYVAVLSHQLWQTQFNEDPGVIGRTVTIDGRGYTVTGVMPAGFAFPLPGDPPQIWTTFSAMATSETSDKPVTAERGAHFINAIARLKPGTALGQANQETMVIGERLASQYPDSNKYLGLRAVSALDGLVGPLRTQLLILLAAVALVLLIACANVASLLLARATGRQREIAVRAAMGASRGRIVQQLLIESGVLSLAGGACGLVLAVWASSFLSRLTAQGIPRLNETGVDGRVLVFAIGVSLVTGLLFGIAPALSLSKSELSDSLKAAGRGAGHSARHNRLRNALVASEIALAVILLTGAGLLMESLMHLQSVNPGFNPHGVLTFTVSLPDSRYPKPEHLANFYRQLFERLRGLPGVESASGALPLPLSNDAIRTGYEIEGHPVSDNDQPRTYMALVGKDYFSTMQIALIKGRLVSDADRADSTPVVIVDKELADKAFPGENPIGKRIKPDVAASGEPPMREIVGVVANVKHHTLDSPDDAFSYVPMEQVPFDDMYGVVRSNLPAATLMPAIREQVAVIDRDIPIYAVQTMDDYVGESVAQPRLDSRLLGIFAGLALALAVIGIYGVMSYTVAQRTNEFGIRIALGAQAGDVRKLVLRQAMRIAMIGVTAGVIGAVAATRLLRTLLFGVQPGDPTTLGAVALVLVVCVLAACLVPAWRAMHVDPIVALRYE